GMYVRFATGIARNRSEDTIYENQALLSVVTVSGAISPAQTPCLLPSSVRHGMRPRTHTRTKFTKQLFFLSAICSLPLCLCAQSPTPNDPQFPAQWILSRIGATNAWAITTGSTNVVVAVIDTGVDYTHPDLAANMWRNPGETGIDANGNDKETNGID